MPRKKEPSFEEALAKLETIVADMEKGEANLKDLVANYSEGVKLGNYCLKALDNAEKAMDTLVKDEAEGVKESKLKIEGE